MRDNGEWTGKAGCALIHRVPESSVQRLFPGRRRRAVRVIGLPPPAKPVRQAAKAKCLVGHSLPEGTDARLMTEGAIGMHRPSGYKDQKPWPWEVILLAGAEPAEADRGQLTAEGINLARELVEIPANDLGRRIAMRAAQKARRLVWKWKCLTKRPSPKWAPARCWLWAKVRCVRRASFV